MDYNLLNQYGIILLIIIFICINIYYKNIINILIFIFSYLGLRNIITDNNALIMSYIISLLYGIIKNFHLLENFSAFIVKNSSNTTDTSNNYNNSDNSDNSNKSDKSDKSNNSNKSDKSDKSNNSNKSDKSDKSDKSNKSNKLNKKSHDKNSELFISDELINQFIKKCKDIDSLLIEKTKQNIYDLKPTIKTMKKSKINTLKKTITKEEIVKPIIISNDNFIVDGHYRWYVKKHLIETNTNGLNINDIYNENINVIKIDYNIKNLLNKLKEHKIKYNSEYLSNNILDSSNIKNGYKLINNIKNDIGKLENIYNLVNSKIKLI